MSHAYGYRKTSNRTCDCGSDYRPRRENEPEQPECRACEKRRLARGKVIPPKAEHEDELRKARDRRVYANQKSRGAA